MRCLRRNKNKKKREEFGDFDASLQNSNNVRNCQDTVMRSGRHFERTFAFVSLCLPRPSLWM